MALCLDSDFPRAHYFHGLYCRRAAFGGSAARMGSVLTGGLCFLARIFANVYARAAAGGAFHLVACARRGCFDFCRPYSFHILWAHV